MTTENTGNEATPNQEAQLDALVAEANARETAFAKGGNPDADVAAAASADAGKTSDEPKADEKPTEGEPKADDKSADEKPAETQDEVDARAVAKEAGVDYDALSTKFAEKGALDADDYQKLAKIGVPKEMVDAYIDGIKGKAQAQAVAYETEVKALVGGPAEYDAVKSWASANLTDAEIAAFDADVLSGNKRVAELAVSALHQRYRAEGGKTPSLLNQGRQTPAAGEVFTSMDEYVNAIQSPKYDKDAAYRASVDAKLARSSL